MQCIALYCIALNAMQYNASKDEGRVGPVIEPHSQVMFGAGFEPGFVLFRSGTDRSQHVSSSSSSSLFNDESAPYVGCLSSGNGRLAGKYSTH